MEQAPLRMYDNPEAVKYSNSLPVGTPASASTRLMKPNNGAVFSYNNQRYIEFNLSANSFLSPSESYLRVTINNTAPNNATIYPQGSIYSMIQSYTLRTADNTIIDRIENFAALASVLMDAQHSKSWKQTTGSIMLGCSAHISQSWRTNDATGVEVLTEEDADRTRNINTGTSQTFCIPLIGLLGSDKYIPLLKLAGGLNLQIELAAPRDAFFSSAAGDEPSYSVSQVSYVARLVNFERDFMAQFDQVMNVGGVELASTTYSHYLTNVGNNAYNMNIPDKSRSIKSIVAIQRPEAGLTSPDYTISRTDARDYDGVADIQFRVGPILYPQEKLRCELGDSSAVYAEFMKSLGQPPNASHHPGNSIDDFNYTDVAYTPGSAGNATTLGNVRKCGKFAFGLDFESFPANSGLECGINSRDQNLPITLEVGRTGTGAQRVDAWVMKDQLILFAPNGALVIQD
jgi:hypothetical protein